MLVQFCLTGHLMGSCHDAMSCLVFVIACPIPASDFLISFPDKILVCFCREEAVGDGLLKWN